MSRDTNLPGSSSQESLGDYMAIFAACVSISAGTLLTKKILQTTPALPLAFVQLAASTAVIWVLALATRRTPSRASFTALALPGVLQPGLVYAFALAGLAITPANVEGLLFAFETTLVVLLSRIFIGERATPQTIMSVCGGTLGIILISGTGEYDSAPPLSGVLLILAGVLAASLDTVISRVQALKADPIAMTAASHIGGLITIGSIVLIWPQTWATSFEWQTLSIAIVSGVLMHGLATTLLNSGLARVSAGATAALFPSIAAMTAIGARIFLDEELSYAQMLGGALVAFSASMLAFARWRLA